MIYTPKQARILANRTMSDVAKALNVSVSTYRRKETGETEFKASEIEAFANYVGLKPSDIDFLCTASSTSQTD